MLKYAVFIIQMSFDDHERYLNATKMQAEIGWRLHQFEMQYNKAICKPTLERGKVAWLTAMTNDDFVIGKLTGCMKCMSVADLGGQMGATAPPPS